MSSRLDRSETDAGASSMDRRVVAYAWKSAYGILGATALAVLLGVGFFAYDGIFAPLSDAGGLLVGLLLVPLVWAMYRLHAAADFNRGVVLIGAASAAGIVVGSAGLILMHVLSVESAELGGIFLSVQFLGWLLLGIWLLGIGLLGLKQETVSRRTSWAAVAAGVGALGGIVTLVYSYAVGSFTLAFPLFMALYAIGFVLWAFWLGGEFRAAAGSPGEIGGASRGR